MVHTLTMKSVVNDFFKTGKLLTAKLFPYEMSSQDRQDEDPEESAVTVDDSSQTDPQSENEAVAFKRKKGRH